jgi:hypothetical protein
VLSAPVKVDLLLTVYMDIVPLFPSDSLLTFVAVRQMTGPKALR